ncbi:glycerophosphodiester phosphodiesterase family protein [Polaribacter sp.]|uniref:glycerophosphodiester phosphodiesterase family protein n=1 Tax=Polaribacter sp. TaxID=1920175 RepID=UPI003428F066
MKYNLLFLICITLNGCHKKMNTKNSDKKIIIAHRGASGYLPEHTPEAKIMAYAMNADFIEQDIVLSKDNIPIVIHDIYLDDVTDVSEKFPKRHREDNRFYEIDFTFKELKTLRVSERFMPETGEQVYKKNSKRERQL